VCLCVPVYPRVLYCFFFVSDVSGHDVLFACPSGTLEL
jgi:hypothetical protein